MKPTTAFAFVLAATLATGASADSRINRFCGNGHENEITSLDDVKPNPDGYYVVSLFEQVSKGDPRIILTNDPGFHLCTRQTATPGMSANDVYRLDKTGEVEFLFVPISDWKTRHSS